MPTVKVWTSDRNTKKCVSLPILTINGLKIKVKEKYNIKEQFFITIVLETDGTEIDSDEALIDFQTEVFLFLLPNQKWYGPNDFFLPDACEKDIYYNNNINTNPIKVEPCEIIQTIQELPTITTAKPDIVIDFEINWELVFTDILYKGANNDKLSDKDIRYLIVNIIDQLRQKVTHPGRAKLKLIADAIIEKIPSLADTDNDRKLIGKGHLTIFKKLEDRNNYLNRHFKNGTTIHGNGRKRNYPDYMRAGCSTMQSNSTFSLDDLEQKREQLSMLYMTCNDNEDQTLLEQTYSLQRCYLNQTVKSIDKLKEDWPMMLNEPYLLWHYNKLLNTNIDECLHSTMNKIPGIFLTLDYHEIMCRHIMEDLIYCLCSYFKEDSYFIIQYLHERQTKEDIPSLALLTPCIFSIGDMYYITIQKNIINDGTLNFESAFKQFFCLFYVFNINYPKEVSLTLEFVQRFLFKINPEKGTKSQKFSTLGVGKKVLSLLSKIKQI